MRGKKMRRRRPSFGKIVVRHLLLATLVVVLAFAFAAKGFADNQSEHAKIDYLLQSVASSHLVFVRNGKDYSGEEAKDHLENKLNFVGKRVRTADEFIIYVASGSSITGAPYYVRFPNGKKEEAAVWLRSKLAAIK